MVRNAFVKRTGVMAADRTRTTVARVVERDIRRGAQASGLILMYHEISAEPGDPQRHIVPALAEAGFAEQLHYLVDRYEVVPLRDLRRQMSNRRSGGRIPVALTFDDDLASHVSTVAPLLVSMDLPATFFLTGAGAHRSATFWWQYLDVLASTGNNDVARLCEDLASDWPWVNLGGGVHELAYTIETLPPGERDEIAERIASHAGSAEVERGLSADSIRHLGALGFEIGFHTLRHYALTTLSPQELGQAMIDGREVLEHLSDTKFEAIAYPHCRANLSVAWAAQQAGFGCGVTYSDAAIGLEQPALLLGRIDGWSPSLPRFALKLARALRR